MSETQHTPVPQKQLTIWVLTRDYDYEGESVETVTLSQEEAETWKLNEHKKVYADRCLAHEFTISIPESPSHSQLVAALEAAYDSLERFVSTYPQNVKMADERAMELAEAALRAAREEK